MHRLPLQFQGRKGTIGNGETLEKHYVPVWGTGGREFKSPRSDHLALLVPIRAATSVLTVHNSACLFRRQRGDGKIRGEESKN